MSLRNPFVDEDEDLNLRSRQTEARPSAMIRAQPARGTGTYSVSAQDDVLGTAGKSHLPASGLALGSPRSRLGGRSKQAASPQDAKQRTDDAVRQTDSDALLSRISALRLGYLPSEPFTQEFLSASTETATGSNHNSGPSRLGGPLRAASSSFEGPAKRSPLINIGTYLRCTSIDSMVQDFLTHGNEQKQIISIGAGSDSRYWRIKSDDRLAPHLSHYLEIDFEQNTQLKIARIFKSPRLRSAIGNEKEVAGPASTALPSSSSAMRSFRSDDYSLLAADVRDLHPEAANKIEPESLFKDLDPSRATLVLFECVLSYIEPRQADAVVQLLGERFPRITSVVYDMCIAGDQTLAAAEATTTRFGKVMLQNLELRSLSLPGAKAYPTISSQRDRMIRLWRSPKTEADEVEVSASSLYQVWKALDQQEKARLSRLEGLDEVEELDMLLRHYCILHVSRGQNG